MNPEAEALALLLEAMVLPELMHLTKREPNGPMRDRAIAMQKRVRRVVDELRAE
jgi:hypothetical protein